MKSIVIFATAALAGLTVSPAAHAQSAGNLLGAPVLATGNLLNGAAGAHAGIAPTVNQISPTVEPVTDGVTNAIAAAGVGVSGTGQNIQANGVLVGTSSNGRPLASIGAQSGNEGRVVGVLTRP